MEVLTSEAGNDGWEGRLIFARARASKQVSTEGKPVDLLFFFYEPRALLPPLAPFEIID